jgi:E3 ubiquitin-protein ligase RNF14
MAKMLADYEEAEQNRQWLEEKTRTCPGCQGRIEKSFGCNHMTCSRCACHFCFRCGNKVGPVRAAAAFCVRPQRLILGIDPRPHPSQLPPTEPYRHYGIPGTLCFNQLFDSAELQRIENAERMGVFELPPEDGDGHGRAVAVGVHEVVPWGALAGQGDDEWPELRF